LIEALVAFVVLALIMTVLQRGVVSSVNAALRAQEHVEAGFVAQTLLSSSTIAELGQPASGRMNGYNWTVRFESVPLAAGVVGQIGVSTFRPMRMIVVVQTSRTGTGVLTAEQIQLVRGEARGLP
jgi:Tfp pilus assembly protein PilV